MYNLVVARLSIIKYAEGCSPSVKLKEENYVSINNKTSIFISSFETVSF